MDTATMPVLANIASYIAIHVVCTYTDHVSQPISCHTARD